ncbi:MAG: hypothetical protein HZA28_03500 [Candidatus Omnitrophica bacterium]|nr:hypothetical protein [Candidatus Omnitrophota bacterium]
MTGIERRVFILGAGASHGSGFNSYRNIKPPLLKDFFKTFAEFGYFRKYEREVTSLLDFLSNTFGWAKDALESGSPDVELVLDSLDAKLNETELHHSLPDYVREGMRCRNFKRIVIELIAEALHRTTWGGGFNPPKCPYHESIAKYLKPGDLIINLNYDLIMDMALINHNWDWINGYALPFDYCYRNHINKWEEIRVRNSHQFYYLKLHGSLNWFISTDVVEERGGDTKIHGDINAKNKLHLVNPASWYENPHLRTAQPGASYKNGNLRFFTQRLIVGPGRKRKYDMLVPLWNIAATQLKDVTQVFIVGCSLRENDQQLSSLLRDNIPWSSLENFIVVDPKEEVKSRFENVFGRGIDCHLKNMEEFSDFLQNKLVIAK